MGSEVSPPRPGPGPCPVTHGLPNLQPQQELGLGSLGLSSSEAISGQSQHRDEQWGKWGGEPGTHRGSHGQTQPCRSARLPLAGHLLVPRPAALTFSPFTSSPVRPLGPTQGRPGLSESRVPCPWAGWAPIGCRVGLGPRLMGYTVGWGGWLDPGVPFPKVRVNIAVSWPWRGARGPRGCWRPESGGGAGRRASEQEAQPRARVALGR